MVLGSKGGIEIYYTLDIEVYSYDWLVVAKDLSTGERFYVWNDNKAVKDFHNENNVYIGFNIKHYDQYILKAILLGAEPQQIKKD